MLPTKLNSVANAPLSPANCAKLKRSPKNPSENCCATAVSKATNPPLSSHQPLHRRFRLPAAKLILELDGSSHDDRIEQDIARDEFLLQNGWHTLRIRNADLMSGESTLATLLFHLET